MFFRKIRTYVANVIALLLFSICLRIGIWFADWVSLKTSAQYAAIGNLNLSEIEQINRKLDYLYTRISGTGFVSTMTVILLYVVLTLIVSYVTAFLISEDIAHSRPAFVRLTRNAEQAKEIALAAYESGWTRFFKTFVVASVAGVVGNILTWFIWV